MTTLLVMTTGQSDVQLVIDGVRHELDPKMCGVLHDEIERRGYRLVDVPARKDRERKEVLPEGELTLCTPKLDAALRYFDGNSPPAAALIFDTRRKLPSDPRFAGAVLERRLNEHGVPVARRHALLTGEELLEDPNDPQDAVVRRAVAEGVAQVLGREFVAVKPDNVVAATTGGLAAANAVIEELVRLHAVGTASVQVVEVPDGAFSAQHDRAVPEKFHPAASFRARWQALSLIEGGSLLGAWGAVSHLAGEPGQEWTKIIDWLRCFASSLPMPDDCDISVLRHPRMAGRAALRVELALRAGDIPRAVHGTVAFFEAALWDHLWPRLTRHDAPGKHRLYKLDPAPDDDLVRRGDGRSDDRGRPFEVAEEIDGVRWYKVFDDDVCGIRLAKHYLRQECLQKLGRAVSAVRELRNDVAHTEPTPGLMDDARHRMEDALLWSTSGAFLVQPLVNDVLRDLGYEGAGSICTDLLKSVSSRLQCPNGYGDTMQR
jgi:hypothetical protein